MEKFTVSFFGHRHIEDHKKVSELLEKAITDIIKTHSNVEFLAGRNGEFDLLVTSAVRSVRKRQTAQIVILFLYFPI